MLKGGRLYTLIMVFLFVVLPLVFAAVALYTDWLFFQETGFTSVLVKTISAKAMSGIFFCVVFLVFTMVNVIAANRVDLPQSEFYSIQGLLEPLRIGGLRRLVKPISIIAVALMSLMAGQWGMLRWEDMLLYLNSLEMGLADPIFGKDMGFYLFKLPMIEFLKGFAVFTLASTIVIVALNYLLRGGILFTEGIFSIEKRVKNHVGILIGLSIFLLALGFYLDTFKLLYSSQGVVSGAGYTDINARLPFLRVLMVITPLAGVIFIIGLFKGSLRLVVLPMLVVAVVYLSGIVVYPMILQKLKVAPNELALEMPFIENSIKFTRKGYDLDRIEMVPFDVDYNLTAADIEKNEATIKNIRLWDHSPLLRTYSQLQQIRTYYKFGDVDNDRYTINGEYMQVMLSPRELSYSDLPSKSWINERLIFTHGNGITLGPVSRISKEGLPEFIIKDIPPVSSADIKVTRPEIYFGELSNDYVIVKTKVPEFSYPTTTENIYTTYNGSGGVRLDSFFKRILFSIRFGTEKILLSTDITSESRILYNRAITERVKKLAPFLHFDKDPYIVVTKEGGLKWIIDGYTFTDRLPYSKPMSRHINYMRNSVKAVIDAYNGSVIFYVSDGADVIIRVYSQIFPEMFKPLNAMPGELRQHIRYPQTFLQAQAAMFALYHMTDPKVFYNKENLWEVPSFGQNPMEPYYTIMKLPGGKKEEYILLLPYVPAKRDNLAAWLAARCDGDNYGRLIAYAFPRDRLVFGPKQVDARINQDSYISQQLTLWNQSGSKVIRGSLLVIPIEKSLLYVQPLYLAASDKVGLPELRRVIAAYENEVVMEEDLEAALNRLFGSRRAGDKKTRGKGEDRQVEKPSVDSKTSLLDLSKEALKVYEKALELQRQGNWAGYGEEIKRLEQLLKRMAR